MCRSVKNLCCAEKDQYAEMNGCEDNCETITPPCVAPEGEEEEEEEEEESESGTKKVTKKTKVTKSKNGKTKTVKKTKKTIKVTDISDDDDEDDEEEAEEKMEFGLIECLEVIGNELVFISLAQKSCNF